MGETGQIMFLVLQHLCKPSRAILAAIIKLEGKACYVLEGHIPHVVPQVGIGGLSKAWRENHEHQLKHEQGQEQEK